MLLMTTIKSEDRIDPNRSIERSEPPKWMTTTIIKSEDWIDANQSIGTIGTSQIDDDDDDDDDDKSEEWIKIQIDRSESIDRNLPDP
jgi:hypothetical protein